jgi:hypothetical protein
VEHRRDLVSRLCSRNVEVKVEVAAADETYEKDQPIRCLYASSFSRGASDTYNIHHVAKRSGARRRRLALSALEEQAGQPAS